MDLSLSHMRTSPFVRRSKYGAVEIGVHRFHHPDHAENIGEAKFMTLWQNNHGICKQTAKARRLRRKLFGKP
jgi:hypothetical protein